ncbi:MAG: hypothetical protein M3321_12350, partial [Actinomycetota bacterium]|nr:hypothetical protein [Actinomycetota bacterium]
MSLRWSLHGIRWLSLGLGAPADDDGLLVRVGLGAAKHDERLGCDRPSRRQTAAEERGQPRARE